MSDVMLIDVMSTVGIDIYSCQMCEKSNGCCLHMRVLTDVEHWQMGSLHGS
jgi:hypothetical protein